MSRRGFDRFMIDLEIGRNLKLRPLTDGEWRAFVGGVLPIAAKSTIRGCLLVGERHAESDDVAAQAGVKLSVARASMQKLREVGVLHNDPELGCDRVHDFEDWNPAPKIDKHATRRQQLHRNAALRRAIRERDGDRCRYCGRDVDFTDRRSPLGGTYDHVDPLGANDLDNLVVSCRACNSKKRDKTPAAAGMALSPISSVSTPDLIGSNSGVSEVEVEEKRTTTPLGGMTPDARQTVAANGEGLRVVGDAA